MRSTQVFFNFFDSRHYCITKTFSRHPCRPWLFLFFIFNQRNYFEKVMQCCKLMLKQHLETSHEMFENSSFILNTLGRPPKIAMMGDSRPGPTPGQGSPAFKCRICQKIFFKMSKLTAHMKIHRLELFCSRMISSKWERKFCIFTDFEKM